jgi:acyl-CoA reductase-like NAD-dependent aldehyde dehydrogenase
VGISIKIGRLGNNADYDETLAVANGADYGLLAGIVSNDRSKIDHFLDNIQASMA